MAAAFWWGGVFVAIARVVEGGAESRCAGFVEGVLCVVVRSATAVSTGTTRAIGHEWDSTDAREVVRSCEPMLIGG